MIQSTLLSRERPRYTGMIRGVDINANSSGESEFPCAATIGWLFFVHRIHDHKPNSLPNVVLYSCLTAQSNFRCLLLMLTGMPRV